jgi:hypothetical protein
MDSVLNKLNNISKFSAATNISIGEMKVDEKYLIERFEKVKTKFGASIVVYIIEEENKKLWRIFVPKKFTESFDDDFINRYNAKEIGEMYITYKGLSQKAFNIVFTKD